MPNNLLTPVQGRGQDSQQMSPPATKVPFRVWVFLGLIYLVILDLASLQIQIVVTVVLALLIPGTRRGIFSAISMLVTFLLDHLIPSRRRSQAAYKGRVQAIGQELRGHYEPILGRKLTDKQAEAAGRMAYHQNPLNPMDLLVMKAAGIKVPEDEGVRQSLQLQKEGDARRKLIADQGLITFAQIGGMEEVKDKIRSHVGLTLKDPEGARRLGVHFNGVLLYGPPGNGKSMFAEAIAGEYDLFYMRANAAEIGSKYVGEAPKKIEEMFRLAKEYAPSLLFFDEFDSLAKERGSVGGGGSEASNKETVNTLLTELSNIRSHRVLVVAATNLLKELDPAVIREGRFDEHIEIGSPDFSARESIFVAQLENRPHVENNIHGGGINYELLAKRTEGMSGAVLGVIVNRAALLALARSQGDKEGAVIEQADLERAIEERKARGSRSRDEKLSWDDWIGPETTKENIRGVVDELLNPEKYERLGVKPPEGMLLYGPPGTGKTRLAEILGDEAGVRVVVIKQSSVAGNGTVGNAEQALVKELEAAKEVRPCIVFIDEMETLFPSRSSGGGTSAVDNRMVTTFLAEFGNSRKNGLVIVGATNRRNAIDSAVLSRFDEQIAVELPSRENREEMLRLYTKVPAAELDFAALASIGEGMSGRDLDKWVQRAGRLAARAGATALRQEDFQGSFVAPKDEAA